MRHGPLPILHVADSAGWAGGETWLRLVAGALDRSHFRMSVVVPEPGPLVAALEALDVPTIQLRAPGSRPGGAALRGLVAVFRRERPLLVQSHGARPNVYTRLAARLAGVPAVVSTVHNSLFDYDVGPWRRRAYVAAETLTSPLADRIVAVSHAIARDLVRRYRLSARRTVVIQNGIDAAAFRPTRPAAAVRAELALSPDARIVGIAGRMTPQKGHDVLLEALRRLAPHVPALACLIIGDGPLRAELTTRAATLGITARCRFTGARADVADLLSAVDAMALPSRSEGLPFALLEAMALGRPVVASAVGGCPEVVEDGVTGRLVPPDDPAALAAALFDVLARPDGAEMGRRGRVHVAERFTLARMVRALERTYVEALAARGVTAVAAMLEEVG